MHTMIAAHLNAVCITVGKHKHRDVKEVGQSPHQEPTVDIRVAFALHAEAFGFIIQ